MNVICFSSQETLMTSATHIPSDIISSSRVEGTPVYNPKGDKLGSIDHLEIEKRSGQVRYAVLEFGGFLGVGSDRYPLPWSMLKYDTDKDGYVVPLEKDRLEKAHAGDQSNQAASTTAPTTCKVMTAGSKSSGSRLKVGITSSHRPKAPNASSSKEAIAQCAR
jgi:hypothetical protein